MRDFSFWRDGAARLGVDLELLGRRGRFVFADGLGGSVATPPPGWMIPLSADAGTPEDVGRAIGKAVDELKGAGRGKVVLVVDQVDLLVATATSDSAGREVREIMLELREVCSCAVRLRGLCSLPCCYSSPILRFYPLTPYEESPCYNHDPVGG